MYSVKIVHSCRCLCYLIVGVLALDFQHFFGIFSVRGSREVMEKWVYLERQVHVAKQGNLAYKGVKVPLEQR